MLSRLLILLILFAAHYGHISANTLTYEDQRHATLHRLAQPRTEKAKRRAASVKHAFETAWLGYYALAFPADELLTISEAPGWTRYGWGATAIESLTTAIVMEDRRVVEQILKHISMVNWGVTISTPPSISGSTTNRVQVNIFEASTRYLGSLLSAYELLSGPHQSLCPDKAQRSMLLQQAVHLADNISFAFKTDSGLPFANVHVNGVILPDGVETTDLSAVGGIALEWHSLARLTSNDTYSKMVEKGMKQLVKKHPQSTEIFPGLIADRVNIKGGYLIDKFGGWDIGSDAFYEMLLKMYIYDPVRFRVYKDRWVLAAESAKSKLAHRVQADERSMVFLARFDGHDLVPSATHLSCSAGASFLLGGAVLQDPSLTAFGLELTESCEDLYNATSLGIGPEVFSWSHERELVKDLREFLELNGYLVTNGGYSLRPELLESLYYAYRMTGDPRYQDLSFRVFKAIRTWTRVGPGFSSFSADVNVRLGDDGMPLTPLRYTDRQDSRFLAETLKYAYLIHAEDAEYQVNHNGSQHWIFSTAGHPLRAAGMKVHI